MEFSTEAALVEVLEPRRVMSAVVAIRPPVARDDSAETTATRPIDIEVTANDSGFTSFSVHEIFSPPSHGTAKIVENDVIRYTPNANTRIELDHALVVDDPTDVEDGNYSAGHLSLREAISLANAYPHISDSFTYAVLDEYGQIAGATVTIDIAPSTTIRFAPRLSGRRLSMSHVVDTSVGNSALVITGSIIIEAPLRGLTFNGLGKAHDLRLFRVLAGGTLTLNGLTMTNWSTDTNGGVMAVDPDGIAMLNHCTLSNNSAVSQGGAIFNSSGQVTLTHCTLNENSAHDGGAYNGGGQTYGFGGATFVACSLRNNTAVDRGGAIALYTSKVYLEGCTLISNSAHQGGGIAGGEIEVIGSSLIGNRAVDGGAIFTGIAAGATEHGTVQAGAPGGISTVAIADCTITGNSAEHRGGGLYLVRAGGGFGGNCTISNNRAQQGGGVYFDNGPGAGDFLMKGPVPHGLTATPSETSGISRFIVSGNVATATGGGVFVSNGFFGPRGWTLANNVAPQGAALFNNLGSVDLERCTVVGNRSRQGTQLFNHLGILRLKESTVSDLARMKFLPVGSEPATQYAAPNPGIEPSAVKPSRGSEIITGADGIRWTLTRDRLLLRQLPGCNWAIMDDQVQRFQVAPNGDCAWLNDRRELMRSRVGSLPDFLGQHVRSFAMDKNGTIYDLSDGTGPGNFVAYASLTSPLLDPVVEIIDDPSSPPFCVEPPTDYEVMKALSIVSRDQYFSGKDGEVITPDPQSPIFNVRMVAEPIVDRIDNVTYFPNIGLARMHHCHYKCTVYYDLVDQPSARQAIIYLDRDYLIRAELPFPESILASQTRAIPKATPTTVAESNGMASLPSNLAGSSKIRSLWMGPDGTIYKLGGDFQGYHEVGHPVVPLELWRLKPGGHWEYLLRVSACEVAPDGTLFVLNTDHELQRQSPGSNLWSTEARGVQSFTMTEQGIVYALDNRGQLIRQQRASRSKQWQTMTLQSAVTSFTVTREGTLYTLNQRNELHRYNAVGRMLAGLQRSVLTLQQGEDGAIYVLDQAGQLRQLNDAGGSSVLASDVVSFQLDADGILYVLNRQHALWRRTGLPTSERREGLSRPSFPEAFAENVGQGQTLPRTTNRGPGHWSLIASDTHSFVLAPNGLRNVYILTTHNELKRLEAGYSWRSLWADVVSVSINADGVITARDSHNQSRLYWSPFIAPVLDPVEAESTPVFCTDPPSTEDILSLTNITAGPNVEVLVEPIKDALDPPRWFGNLGNNVTPNVLHHCLYRCTVYDTTDPDAPRTLSVIEVDVDHFIRWTPGLYTA